MKNNHETDHAKNAVKGIASKSPLQPRRSMLRSGKKGKKEQPSKPIKVSSERITEPPINVTSERVTKEEDSGPINVRSERVNAPEPRVLSAPSPAKKASKPRKPRDVKYTQPTLPGMRNTRQFKNLNGNP